MVHPFYSGFCSFLQNELLCLPASHPGMGHTKLPPQLQHSGPLVFCVQFLPRPGFSYDSSPTFISGVKLSQPVNRKKKVRWDFVEGLRTKAQSCRSRKTHELGYVRGHHKVWCLWLSDWLSVASKNPVLPVAPQCYQEHGLRCTCAGWEGRFSLSRPL